LRINEPFNPGPLMKGRHRMHFGLLYFYFFLQMLLQQTGYAAISPMPQAGDIPVIKADVALVPVDVMVRSKDDAYVDNLKADNFVVYDNGVTQEIAFFSREEMPLDVALVVDGSDANHRYIPELQKAAAAMIQRLSQDDRVVVFGFGFRAIQLTGFTQDRVILDHALGKIPFAGGTNIKDALWTAARRIQSAGSHRRRAIILISDRHESVQSEHGNEETLVEMLESGAILYIIRAGRSDRHLFIDPSKEIASLAEKTGGEVLDAKSPPAFHKALDSIITSLKRSYTLGFYPSDQGKGGSYRTLKVKLNSDAGYSIRARAGYYVPESPTSKSPVLKVDKKIKAPEYSSYNVPNFTELYLQSGDMTPSMLKLVETFIGLLWNHENNYELKRQVNIDALKRIDFAATAKNHATQRDKNKVEIALKISVSQLPFQFEDGRYNGTYVIAALQYDSLESDVKVYKLSIPEEEFRQALQRELTLSIAVSPRKRGEMHLVLFEPASQFFGVQKIKIQPQEK
jgi:Ca-activated chloride channel homolog